MLLSGNVTSGSQSDKTKALLSGDLSFSNITFVDRGVQTGVTDNQQQIFVKSDKDRIYVTESVVDFRDTRDKLFFHRYNSNFGSKETWSPDDTYGADLYGIPFNNLFVHFNEEQERMFAVMSIDDTETGDSHAEGYGFYMTEILTSPIMANWTIDVLTEVAVAANTNTSKPLSLEGNVLYYWENSSIKAVSTTTKIVIFTSAALSFFNPTSGFLNGDSYYFLNQSANVISGTFKIAQYSFTSDSIVAQSTNSLLFDGDREKRIKKYGQNNFIVDRVYRDFSDNQLYIERAITDFNLNVINVLYLYNNITFIGYNRNRSFYFDEKTNLLHLIGLVFRYYIEMKYGQSNKTKVLL